MMFQPPLHVFPAGSQVLKDVITDADGYWYKSNMGAGSRDPDLAIC